MLQMKSLKLSQTQEAGSIFLNELKNILITVLSATAVVHGDMTLGMMLAVQYIIGQLNGPVEQLMGLLYSLQDVKISLERIGDIHQSEEECSEGEVPVHAGSIELKDVCFKYDYHSPHYTLDHVSMTIPSGKMTAIVGASGSGKTTLVKLLLGYYPLNEGSISVGGRDINQMDLGKWRSVCGVVMQDGVIFSDTIAGNINMSDDETDVERLEQVADMACIRDFVMSLPLRFNTKIGRDGVGISLGQKQRILIARAMYRQPEFIFLDEATNSLDAVNERMIVENLEQFCQGRTVVVVAHRLSTVRHADQIIVLEKGRIVETGTHDELTSRRGAYYQLVRNQLELGE